MIDFTNDTLYQFHELYMVHGRMFVFAICSLCLNIWLITRVILGFCQRNDPGFLMGKPVAPRFDVIQGFSAAAKQIPGNLPENESREDV